MERKRSNSRSDAQHVAERAAIEALSSANGLVFAPRRLVLRGRAFNVDGCHESEGHIILAEAWAHVGRAKAAQRHKVLSDLLKLALLSRLLLEEQPERQVRAVLVFIDAEAARVVQNDSWGALAASEFKVQPVIVALEPAIREAVRAAQVKQDLRSAI